MCAAELPGAIPRSPDPEANPMMTRPTLTVALVLALTSACSEGAESSRDVIELPADLMARAEVTVEAAKATALAHVPGGVVAAGELEEEGGELIYSFDIRVEGSEGIEEVHVDAITGAVVGQEHEDGASEAAEADDEVGR
jgi:hypothetical protein